MATANRKKVLLKVGWMLHGGEQCWRRRRRRCCCLLASSCSSSACSCCCALHANTRLSFSATRGEIGWAAGFVFCADTACDCLIRNKCLVLPAWRFVCYLTSWTRTSLLAVVLVSHAVSSNFHRVVPSISLPRPLPFPLFPPQSRKDLSDEPVCEQALFEPVQGHHW